MGRRIEFDWWGNPSEENWSWGQPDGPWPKEVPILSARNIRHGKLGQGDCRCLLGWTCGFPTNHLKEIDELLLQVVRERSGFETIDDFNDSRSKQEVADVFNEAMRRKGYTQPV